MTWHRDYVNSFGRGSNGGLCLLKVLSGFERKDDDIDDEREQEFQYQPSYLVKFTLCCAHCSSGLDLLVHRGDTTDQRR